MKSRPVFGILLIILAFYAIYVYDTGRWNLLKQALTGPPGQAPLGNQAGGGSVLPPGNHPIPGTGPLPPALPSSATPGIVPGMTGPASWLGAGQSIINQIWPKTPAPTAPVPTAIGPGTYTPGIWT